VPAATTPTASVKSTAPAATAATMEPATTFATSPASAERCPAAAMKSPAITVTPSEAATS
jgi:hypothetical protein